MSDYPTEADLKAIGEYDLLKSGVDNFLELIKSLWWMSERQFELKGKRVKYLILHTGGWSGNEDIIYELRQTMFWIMYWQKSVRGGHFYFKITPAKNMSV